jgi:hypothetical protein
MRLTKKAGAMYNRRPRIAIPIHRDNVNILLFYSDKKRDTPFKIDG